MNISFGVKTHFIATTALMFVVCYFQSNVLALNALPWLYPDLISIVVFYFAIEHFLWTALAKIILAATFMEMTSLTPPGFFLMYFSSVLVLGTLISRHVVVHNQLGQFLLFASLFMLKYVMLYFLIIQQAGSISMPQFLLQGLSATIITALTALPVVNWLAKFDGQFQILTLSSDP